MFNITHTAKPGVCKARRCSKPLAEDGLCEKHYAEWAAAGKPPFGAEGTAMAETSALDPKTREDLETERANANKALALIQALTVSTQETMDQAGAWMSAARTRREAVEAAQKARLEPIKKMVCNVSAAYKPLIKVYQEAEDTLRGKMNAHLALQAQLQAEARAKVEAEGGKADADTLVVAHGVENVALPVGMGVRKSWDAQVVSELALRRAVALGEIIAAGAPPEAVAYLQQLFQVSGPAPREWLVVDLAFAKSQAAELQDRLAVPGVAVAERHGVTAARRK